MFPMHHGADNKPKLVDEVNKSSPFDDVPGLKTNHFQRVGRKNDVRKECSNLTAAISHKACTSDTSCTDRSNWIRFEENKTANPNPGAVSKSATRQVDVHTKNVSHSNISPDVMISPKTSTRKEWVSFGSPAPIAKVDKHSREEPTSNTYIDDTEETKMLNDEEENNKNIKKSIENLLDVVDKTVTSLKGNIKKNGEGIDGKSLLDPDDDAKSELSDEVISLDYESEEENKKLRDTPIKKFADVSLFQASSLIKSEKAKSMSNGKRKIEIETPVTEPKELDNYPPKVSRDAWEFLYRYPDRKKQVGPRKWVPVKVVVEGELITLTGSLKSGVEIIKEIPLHPFFVFTIPTTHKGDKDGNVHSVKLQYVKYEENRRFQKGKRVIEHIPAYTPVLKIANRNILELKEFIVSVDTVIRNIPTYRDKGIAYRYEEMFIDCEDDCQFFMSGDGKLLLYSITVMIRLRVFITGNPELKLFLNDFNNKDILSKTKETLLRESKPPSNWITPQNLEYHPCVDELKSQCEGGIVFSPPDGCSFELLRFRVSRKGTLPLTCTSSAELVSNTSLRLYASVQVAGDAKAIRYKRNCVLLYFPIPETWGNLFVKNSTLRGVKKYLKVRGCKKASTSVTKSTNHVTLQLSAGEASYDPSFGAIVWKLGCLPFIHGELPADAIHSFQCCIEFPATCKPDDEFEPYAYVQFNISQPFASDVSIEEVLLSDGKVPDKWVCYRSNYTYKISMKVKREEKAVIDSNH